ncbi:MAG TPA: molecular chaperone TorD family protein [Syntrophobacteria bacterium]|nr:molecular chaperone TorD family protein [Syntrophobacteria bacterium]
MSPDANLLRAYTYGLLAGLLAAPPSASLLRLLDQIPGRVASGGTLAGAWTALKEAASETSIAEVAEEYQQLFVGVGGGEVMLYGSWYLSGFLADKPLAVLRADLAALGVERRPEVRETEDHAAALCETMAMICAGANRMSSERQKKFFDEHVVSWMTLFFRNMQQAPSACFYRAVGRLGAEFLEVERAYLSLEG